MRSYIGVDLGGTHVRAGIVNENGEIKQVVRTDSHPENGPEALVQTIGQLIRQLPEWEKAEAVGIGLPGILTRSHDSVIMANNLPLIEGYPLAQKLEENTGKHVVLGNDGKVAALAEALQGAGKGKETVFFITLSTGVGGALVHEGKVLMGSHGFAGEICNLITDCHIPPRNRLNPGALENEASGTAIAYYGQEQLSEMVESAADVFKLAEAGDEKALQILETMTDHLAIALANIAHITDPDLFIFSGGMMNSKDLFMEKTREKFEKRIFAPMRDIGFVQAALQEPGLIGAAMLPMSLGL